MRKNRLIKKNHKLLPQLFIVCISALALSLVINLSLPKKVHITASKSQIDPTYDDVAISTLFFEGASAEFPVFGLKNVDQSIEAYVHSRLASIHSSKGEKTITYNILHYSKQTLSVLFTDSKGIAEMLTYDLEKEAIITFEDLFHEKHISGCLEIVAEIASSELKKNNSSSLSAKEIFQVTAPKAENYSDFIVYNQAIVFRLALNDQHETYQLAISKHLFDDRLLDEYKSGQQHDDQSGNYEPANIISERPAKETSLSIDQKVIALTFDDGPKAGVTDVILDALEQYEAKATFFVLGSRGEANAAILKRMAEEGHEIGNHTWDHPKMTSIGSSAIAEQIDKTKTIIKQITGTAPTLFRPPYGLFNERVSSYVGKDNLILWDVDTLDWKYRCADKVIPEAVNAVKEGSIILMHDIYASSAEAAAEIIRELSLQGYKFVTVSELLEIKEQEKTNVHKTK